MIRLLICDDHPIVRKGLRQIIEEQLDIEVVAECGNGCELISKIMEIDLDVILLDIAMPGRSGISLLKEIKQINPKIAILILSVYSEEQYAIKSLKMGASGYLTKSSVPDELILAIRKAAIGKKYITEDLAERLAFDFDETESKPLHSALSDRELEVMCMLGKGDTAAQIAEKLSLSIKTVSTYRQRILTKLKLKSTAEIIRFAIKEGFVE